MNSFISWIGGKKLLRNKIIEQFPDTGSYDRYVEVFGGAGWVLFARDSHAKMEVYNDVNGELVNLYRIIKHHPEALHKELEWLLMSRELFFDELNRNVRIMTDIQRAARYFIIIRESFGSDCRTFGVRSINIEGVRNYLLEVSKRLNRVVIENNDFERILRTYDRETALFYLDPPYYEAEKYYPDRFNPEDHVRLRDALSAIKGYFVLSYNDCPKIRELYEGFTIIEVERNDNLVTKNGAKRYRELIIKNYQ